MTVEKPLHVKVAEALGCKPWHDDHVGWRCGCGEGVLCFSQRYGGLGLTAWDTDWSATGPIIEKYGFWLRQLDQTLSGPQPWDAFRNDDQTFPRGFGPTPLIAVCRLILALAEAGVLKAA